jgi:hypothetical protein
MLNVKTKGLPPIARATGTISKSLRQYLNSVPGKHDIKELQKAALLGTARTYFTEYCCRSTKRLSWQITLHVITE